MNKMDPSTTKKIMQAKMSIVLRLRNFALNKSLGNEILLLSFFYHDVSWILISDRKPSKERSITVKSLSDTEVDFTPRSAT